MGLSYNWVSNWIINFFTHIFLGLWSPRLNFLSRRYGPLEWQHCVLCFFLLPTSQYPFCYQNISQHVGGFFVSLENATENTFRDCSWIFRFTGNILDTAWWIGLAPRRVIESFTVKHQWFLIASDVIICNSNDTRPHTRHRHLSSSARDRNNALRQSRTVLFRILYLSLLVCRKISIKILVFTSRSLLESWMYNASAFCNGILLRCLHWTPICGTAI